MYHDERLQGDWSLEVKLHAVVAWIFEGGIEDLAAPRSPVIDRGVRGLYAFEMEPSQRRGMRKRDRIRRTEENLQLVSRPSE